MLRGPLHDRGPDGRSRECGEPFPCPTGIAIYEAVKRELEHPTPAPLKARSAPRQEGRYRVRFIKAASVASVEPRGRMTRRPGDEMTLIWRPSRQAEGDRCYEHFDNKGKPLEEISAHADANRHASSWWTDYDVDGAMIFNDCQVEVLDGPLKQQDLPGLLDENGLRSNLGGRAKGADAIKAA